MATADEVSELRLENRSSEALQGTITVLHGSADYEQRQFRLAPGASEEFVWDGWYGNYAYQLDGGDLNSVRMSLPGYASYYSSEVEITWYDDQDELSHRVECSKSCRWP
ncbi:hypothetical protein [Thioalkalivibrio sp. ALJ1]|uniref:hypothetical protein n=1 Tax=Thioalkalivibrio sp. ALJ1 TaxID=1158144 RepID=UPI000AC34F45